MPTRRVPLNVFGMGFGLSGLATTWRIAADLNLATHWIGDALAAIASVVWAGSCVHYLQYALTTPGALSRDLRDMTAGPFASLAIITPMLLAANGIAPYVQSVAAVVVDILVVLVLLLGGWFTGYWMRGGTDLDRLHPGYFLPTVAGGLVASAAASKVGQPGLAEVMLGLGLICWAIIGSMILTRLIFRPPLPDALAPTMAIEVAPAAVASLAHFAANGGRIDMFAALLAGYGLLMVVAQLPLLPRYLGLPFSLGTWAFTFSWTAVAGATLFWIASAQFAGRSIGSYVVLSAISCLIGGIAARTLLGVWRGRKIGATRSDRQRNPNGSK